MNDENDEQASCIPIEGYQKYLVHRKSHRGEGRRRAEEDGSFNDFSEHVERRKTDLKLSMASSMILFLSKNRP